MSTYGGVHEIAELAGVTKQAVCNWTKRHPTFPQPLAKLHMGPIYNLKEVKTWLVKSKRPSYNNVTVTKHA